MHKRLLQITALTLCVLFLCSQTPARAGILRDPEPRLSWDGMLRCELVFVGRYESHTTGPHGQILSLRVVRTLKGPGIKEGDIVPVALQHWYSVQTGKTDRDFIEPPSVAGVPALCYKGQIMNPGDLVPLRLLADARQPALYFIPKAAAPALRRPDVVLPTTWVDDWQHALRGEPMSLAFRLVQDVNPVLQRNALEELYAHRDAATLDRLASLSAEEPLIAVGDKNGDIYNRAFQRLANIPLRTPSSNETYALGRIMAGVNPQRATVDFIRAIEGAPSTLQDVALECLGYTATRGALEEAFKLLRQPKLTYGSAQAVEMILERNPLLRAGAAPEIWRALQDPILDKSQLYCLTLAVQRYYLGRPVSIQQAQAVLLRHGPALPRGDNSVQDMLENVINTSDAHFVPILWQTALDPSSAGSQKEGSGLEWAIEYYSLICPNATRLFMKDHVTRAALSKDDNLRAMYDAFFPPAPTSVEDLEESPGLVEDEGQLKKIHTTPAVMKGLRKSVQEDVLSTDGPDALELQILFSRDPATAKRFITRAIARQNLYHWDRSSRAEFLALAVRYGHKGLAAPLIRDVRVLKDGDHNLKYTFAATDLLLLANDPRAMEEYLRLLDNRRHVYLIGRTWALDSRYEPALHGLFPRHPAPYFDRVLNLLESPLLPERLVGEAALGPSLSSSEGFNATDFAPQREREIGVLRSLLSRAANLTELQLRVLMLARHGVHLPGSPGVGWLLPLSQAAASPDYAVYSNALRLFDQIAGSKLYARLNYLPPAVRERALRAYLNEK